MDRDYYFPLLCGATAGLIVDLTLYPLDTIKTRIQSTQGFIAAGGFRNVYSGMGSVMVGSMPSAAVFFSTYSFLKDCFTKECKMLSLAALVHAFSAGSSEVAACIVRVPTELVKQRAQIQGTRQLIRICNSIYQKDGVRGFYRGFFSTVYREIPFSLIEFPIWEALKQSASSESESCSPLMSAACGSAAGSLAAAITTPLDVAKTRIMLDESPARPGVLATIVHIWTKGGLTCVFAGLIPRSLSMAIGGFVFFGVYETTLALSKDLFEKW